MAPAPVVVTSVVNGRDTEMVLASVDFGGLIS